MKKERIHILGICGTFMGGIAVLAKQQGHTVTGSDANIYPPMSLQLEAQGIGLMSGFAPEHLQPAPDCVIVGNAMSRGNPAIEYMLNAGLPYTSGPQWLAENVLAGKHVLAVAGTHGKTTTSSLLAWILEDAGLNPGFLIGGVPENFGVSARLGIGKHFVIEADEYDTAYFDKRSKFIHYRPETLILNNLEFDHADIFPDLAAIQRQFHHLVRTVPSQGRIVCASNDENLRQVLAEGCWTTVDEFGLSEGKWQARDVVASGREFSLYCDEQLIAKVEWSLLGLHNVRNALAAIAAAANVGVDPRKAASACASFQNVKRRLEKKGEARGIAVYDDFAHHPTAIATTLEGLRGHVKQARIVAVVELGSYTMRTGVHKKELAPALATADRVFFLRPPGEDWGIAEVAGQLKVPASVSESADQLLQYLLQHTEAGDHILMMSNTGFSGIHDRLLAELKSKS